MHSQGQSATLDPMGAGFPPKIQGMMQAFYAKQDTDATWNHHVWKHKLQRDGHHCGVWTIWLNEPWTQYWNAVHENNTFEFFCMQHMSSMPKGQTLRLHYHNMVQNAQTPDLSNQTNQLQDMAHKRVVNGRLAKSSTIEVQDSPIQAPTKNRPQMTSDTAQTLHATDAQDASTEAANETANNVSQHEPQEGRAHEHRHAGVAAGEHMYLEKQDKQHCQVHSLNALLGRKAVSPQDMVNFCQLGTT